MSAGGYNEVLCTMSLLLALQKAEGGPRRKMGNGGFGEVRRVLVQLFVCFRFVCLDYFVLLFGFFCC